MELHCTLFLLQNTGVLCGLLKLTSITYTYRHIYVYIEHINVKEEKSYSFIHSFVKVQKVFFTPFSFCHDMPTQWRSIYSNTSRWRCVCIIDRNTIRLPQQVKVNTFVYTEEAVKQLIDINSARAPCTHICTCSFITLQQFHAQALCRSLPLRFISHIFQRWMKRSKVTWPFLFPASFPHHLCRASDSRDN